MRIVLLVLLLVPLVFLSSRFTEERPEDGDLALRRRELSSGGRDDNDERTRALLRY